MSNPTEPSKDMTDYKGELEEILDDYASHFVVPSIPEVAGRTEAIQAFEALLDQEYQRGYNAALKGMEITNLTDNSTILWDYQDTFTIRYKVGDKWVDVAELKKTRGTE